MDSKRLLLALSISIAILVIFQVLADYFLPKPKPHPAMPQTVSSAVIGQGVSGSPAPSAPGGAILPPSTPAPRVLIAAPLVRGSISLRGAKLDQLILTHYHETVSKTSPLVHLLAPPEQVRSNYVQFGWEAAPGQTVQTPGTSTIWSSSGGELTPDHPIMLSWTDPQNVTFRIILAVDQNYMFTVHQEVINHSGGPVAVYPWSRVRQDYLPTIEGSFILHEGPIGVFNGTLNEMSYAATRSHAKNSPTGTALSKTDTGGWVGITSKYWLTALIPSQDAGVTASYRYQEIPGRKADDGAYQADMITATPIEAAPGATAAFTSRVFAGAKVLHILNSYQKTDHIPNFDRAIDFGWFYFLTKPIFLALDMLSRVFGNFGIAIIVFTVLLKIVLFPLVHKSFTSMAKMRLVAPKIKEIRERVKDDPARQQKEIMAVYKAEGVNPAAGCLPMLVQVPIFFALYKVIFITIEMRHAPFFLWIHDLSAEDPTNIFNLFGLLPFHPSAISPFLHVGVLPILMGTAQYFSQRMSPAPPDPTQARMMQFMPVIYAVMLARFPAGLVLYYTTNNFLTMIQQWVILRSVEHRPHPKPVSTGN